MSHTVEGPPTPPPDSPTAAQPVFKGAKMTPHSGTNTPDFVQTTLEVADTAAQIDPRTPDPVVSDEEAGRIGYRRLSSTPIAEVSATAAEVANVAADLDFDEIDDVEVDIGPDFSHELAGQEDNGQDEAPVFAYEFAGAGYDRTQSFSGSEYSPGTYPTSGLDGAGDDASGAQEQFDLRDPTLEKFPSNREGIFQRVRKLESGLTEDTPSFDGFPASPVVSAGRKSSSDLNGEPFSISPTSAATHFNSWSQNNGNGSSGSGSFSQESRRRSASKGSVAGAPSPSLHCINEENALDEEDEDDDALLSMPTHHKKPVPDKLGGALKTAATPPLPPVRHMVRPEQAPAIVVHRAKDTTPSTIPGAFPDSK